MFPAPVKMILYYTREEINEPILSFKIGSHRKYWNSFYIDKIVNITSKVKDITYSTNGIVVFDTSIYHKALDTGEKTVYLVICSFCPPHQSKLFNNAHLYTELNDSL